MARGKRAHRRLRFKTRSRSSRTRPVYMSDPRRKAPSLLVAKSAMRQAAKSAISSVYNTQTGRGTAVILNHGPKQLKVFQGCTLHPTSHSKIFQGQARGITNPLNVLGASSQGIPQPISSTAETGGAFLAGDNPMTNSAKKSVRKSERLYIDFHNDTVLRLIYEGIDFRNDTDQLSVSLPKIKLLKRLKALVFAICVDPAFVGNSGLSETIRIARLLKATIHDNDEVISLALSAQDIDVSTENSKVSIMMALEGGYSIDDSIDNLAKLHEEGIRILTLAHVKAPSWAGSAHVDHSKGLSNLGRDIIVAMNDIGMVIDVAHTAEQTIHDAARISRQPIVCSHVGCRSLLTTPVNLSDNAIKAIAGTGGVIGIIFYPGMLADYPRPKNRSGSKKLADLDRDTALTPQEKAQIRHRIFLHDPPRPKQLPGVDALFNHIDHIVQLVGDDHVALGSDFDGVPYYCRGLEDITKFDDLAQYLGKRGYSKERVRKIMGTNISRVLSEVFKD